MSQRSTSSKPKRNLADSLRHKLNKAFKGSSSSSTTQPPPATSNPQSHQSSPPIAETTGGASVSSFGTTVGPSLAATPAPSGTLGASAAAGSPISASLPENATSKVPTGDGANPARRKADGLLAPLGAALRTLHEASALFPPLQSAVGALIPGLDILEDAAKYRREYEELASELISSSEVLVRYLKEPVSAQMSESISDAARSISEQIQFINQKGARSTGARLLESNSDDEELMKCYRRIQGSFRKLQADMTIYATRIAEEQQMTTRLNSLSPAKLANYDSKLSTEINRRTCTDHTRTVVLSGLDDWSQNLGAADVYWMNGMAGTGKTTIACTFSKRIEERKQLAASFFCTRTSPECRDAGRIIPTISYQLAHSLANFRSALHEILGENPDITSKAIPRQFDKLLKEPLLKVKDSIPGNMVIVVDALDECENRSEMRLILETLSLHAAELPLKFFVTSRPEPEIYEQMQSQSRGSKTIFHLHEIERSLVQADIEIYLREELEFMSPALAQIKELAQRSGNLFIYAATLVRYIRPRKRSIDPQKRLRSALEITSKSNKVHAEIDELYAAVLEAALDEEDMEEDEIESTRLVLWTAVCVQEPVDIETIAALAGLDDTKQALTAMDALRSVIHFSETSGLVSTLHASFPEFMLNKGRSGVFFLNEADHNQLLARQCFDTMKAQLHFNICQLSSSFLLDKDVKDLGDRVKQFISPCLWYTCRYWGDHLHRTTYSGSLESLLENFLSVHLLFWIEVLNLKQQISLGTEILATAQVKLKDATKTSIVARLIEDARNFVTTYAANPISQSTPHLYISLLPFCPKSSSVYKSYWKKARGLINVTGNATKKREVAALASWEIGELYICSVDYSPDDTCIGYGCSDGTVAIRSAYNGALVAGPFEGHTKSAMSVKYSPDGGYIASGSKDFTVRVWNAQNGALAGLFKGHTDSVLSVAWSPDGRRVASASDDCTVRLWDVGSGALFRTLLEGSTIPVWTVAYSPNGKRVVSGSHDGTIRFWDSEDGSLVEGPFEVHNDWIWSVAYSPDGARVTSCSADGTIHTISAPDGTGPTTKHDQPVYWVAYSPDGTRIVSASGDRTIRIWDSVSGLPVADPLEGHDGAVWSVAYAHDGTRIASGSSDGTIKVWSVEESALAINMQEGHTDSIRSVAYSPDGTRIASASVDEKILIWNAENGTLVAGPFEGHNDVVLSVAFSPDGARIVSGARDFNLTVWDAESGATFVGPFQGHTGFVNCVAYSPDGTRIISGSNDSTIRIWVADTAKLAIKPIQGHTGPVLSIQYSFDGTRIVSSSHDGSIRVWNSQDGTLVMPPLEGHTGPVWSVTYSPDGLRLVSGSTDRSIRVWDANDGALVTELPRAHTHWVRSVAYMPDGTCMISASGDNTIKVWNAKDYTPLAGPFEGHTNWILSLGCSPNGEAFATGSDDYTIRVWNLSKLMRHVNDEGLSTQDALSLHSKSGVAVLADWHPQTDGWITNGDQSCCFFWVPSDIINVLPNPQNDYVINSYGSLRVDYDNLFIGDRWQACYVS